MSSKFKVLSIALVALMALAFYSATTKADVTGSFQIHLSFAPIPCQFLDNVLGSDTLFPDQPCEKTIFKIDFQTALDINVAISGLTIGLHSHAGVTGFEDIILSFATTLGALEISDTFVFAQPFAFVVIDENGNGTFDVFDEAIPTCLESDLGSGSCLTLFVKKRVEATISLGGVTFTNLAIFEDVNFPNCGLASGFSTSTGFCIKGEGTGVTYTTQSQAFGFGDVITIEGQTPSGITVTSETGICAQQDFNIIKKHFWFFTVNPECAAGSIAGLQKGPFLFDFEKLWIEGIPLAAGLTLDLHVECNVPGGLLCGFFQTWTITGGPIFNSIVVDTGFEGLPLGATGTSFADITVTAAGGPLSLVLVIDPGDFLVDCWAATSRFTINPDTNPASLRIRATSDPIAFCALGDLGLGADLSFIDFALTIRRAGLSLTADVDFDVASGAGDPDTFNFDDLTLSLSAEAGIVNISASIVYKEENTTPEEAFLLGGDLFFTVNF